MKKLLNLISIFVITIFVLTACNKSWHTIDENEVKCGGNIGKVEYLCIANIYEDMSEDEVIDATENQVAEGYDVALGIYEEDNLQFRIKVNTDKGYTQQDAQDIVDSLTKLSEEKEVYEHELFVEVIKDFMEKRWD